METNYRLISFDRRMMDHWTGDREISMDILKERQTDRYNADRVGQYEDEIKGQMKPFFLSGRVLDKTLHEDRIHIKARVVKFSWQRGVKIGQILCFSLKEQRARPMS